MVLYPLMRKAGHSSEFSLIIIHKIDRFERNFRAMTNTLEDLANIGVRVYSIYENLILFFIIIIKQT